MTIPHRQPRRGFTLVEILAAMAALMFVTGVCVALITVLVNLSDSSERHAGLELAIAKAARAFREDVRSADAADLRAKDGELACVAWLSVNGSTVEYSVGSDSVYRVETIDDTVVAHEQFQLPEKSFPRFERFEIDGKVFLALVFDRRGGKTQSKAAIRLFRIEAALGEDTRFQGGTP
jgi:hypothetical protein